jgi:hypothetical protein
MDVRIAATRALGRFSGYQPAEALVHVLQNEKDVALCDCARDSLERCADQEFSPGFKNWNEVLLVMKGKETGLATEPSFQHQVIRQVSGMHPLNWF